MLSKGQNPHMRFMHDFGKPAFNTVGEGVDFFRQIFEDLMKNAKQLTHTQGPPKYYFIDHGLAKLFHETQPWLMTPICGSGHHVPKIINNPELLPVNPFAVDIFCVGHLIQPVFLDVSRAKPKNTVRWHRRKEGCMCVRGGSDKAQGLSQLGTTKDREQRETKERAGTKRLNGNDKG
ncbi:hypothetical protein B0H10DRAFT_1942278 [Mycena sp. CBHHK59/15]|nr:hypothetical protein B0H10DRAFT_1942278 [Mycena sp. CBHHK59/15]